MSSSELSTRRSRLSKEVGAPRGCGGPKVGDRRTTHLLTNRFVRIVFSAGYSFEGGEKFPTICLHMLCMLDGSLGGLVIFEL